MSNAARFAVAGVLAGLLLAVVGLWQSGAFSSDRSRPDVTAQLGPDGVYPDHGLLPYNEVVEVWSARSSASDSDYISRTNLGSALAGIGSEQADLEKYEEAEVVLREALTINESYGPAQLLLASVLNSQHRFDEARQLARSIHREDPNEVSALALIGDASLELGDLDDAAEHYEELVALERSAPTVSRLARLASMRGDSEAAVEFAEEALDASTGLALRPHQAAFYWFQLGHFRFEAGDFEGAVSDLEAALTIAPDHPGANEEYVFALAAVGRTDEALEAYEALIEAGGASDVRGLDGELFADRFDVEALDE